MTNLRENRILPLIGRRLFSAPYMPRLLILPALVIIITNAFFILIGQPAEYWLDYTLADVANLQMQQIVATHPLALVGVAIMYVMVVGLLLDGLSRSPALVLWMVVCFLHLQQTLIWLDNGLYRLFGLSHAGVHTAASIALAVVFAGIMGILGSRALLSKPPASDVPPRSRFAYSVATVTIAWLLLLTWGLVRVVSAPASVWRPIVVEHRPSPRVEGAIAYDTNRQKAVMFGGLSGWFEDGWVYESDTWEWDGAGWVQRLPQTSPPGRGSHAMAYDAKRGVVVLFGGENRDGVLNDTWEWDGEQWRQHYPLNSPSARQDHRMFYDTQRDKVMLYGGYGPGYLNDAWEWDGAQWQQISFETKGPAASGFGLAYDETLNRAVALISGYEGGTWVWWDDHWGKPQLETEHPERPSVGLVYDPLNEHMISFGGIYQEQRFNDTWILEVGGWRELELPSPPPTRWGHVMFYDHSRDKVIVFGGFGEDYLNDMWELEFHADD